MTTLILVRHGESVANREGIYQGQIYDTPLTDLGKIQAKLAVGVLINIPIDRIISSPLTRCKQTAEIINEHLGKEIELDKDIQEISHGLWEGQTFKWVEDNYGDLLKIWQTQPTQAQMPNGENLQNILGRVKSFLKKIENCNQSILVVSHDAILRTMISDLIGLPLDNFWQLHLTNCGISIVTLGGKYPTIEVLNSKFHLEEVSNTIAL